MTFADLLEDLMTRPMGFPGAVQFLDPWKIPSWLKDLNGRALSPIERLVWKYWGWRAEVLCGPQPMVGDREYRDLTWRDFAPIRDMNVVEWAKQLRNLCDWDNLQFEETWT